jgi:predicted MFS family arabinose efflux permease
VFGAITGVAVAVGPVLGGALTSGLSWRWIFFVNVPIGVAALVVTLTRVTESRAPGARRPDWPGCVTFTAALTGLVFGLIRSHPDGWGSTTVVASLAAAVVLLAAFIVIELRSRRPMLDLELLRVPTFDGGLIAAWTVSASIFSLLTYVVIYLQNILGYSAIQTGVRVLPLTGAVFFTAGIAGRLTGRVQTRWLIGPGFALVGAGLLLMHGISAGDDWTHLLPGLVVAGIGAGLINVPLASTAVGVVEPARAGMASGINSTLRQVGIATGVAAFGSILASQVSGSIVSQLSGGPLAGHAHQLAHAAANGQIGPALANVPGNLRGMAAQASLTGFVDSLNTILLIGAILAFAGAVATVALIRQRDFVAGVDPGGGPDPESVAQAIAT